MKKEYKISVIIPVTYLPVINYGIFLSNQLECFKNCYEIIIIDNTDVSGYIKNVLKKYKKLKNVKVIQYPFKFSLPKMFNYAEKFVTGDYILFIRNFCLFGKNLISKLIKFLDDEENTCVFSAVVEKNAFYLSQFEKKIIDLSSSIYLILKPVRVIYFFLKRKSKSGRFFLSTILLFLLKKIIESKSTIYKLFSNYNENKSINPFFGLILVKKEDFEKLGGFDENYYNFFYDTDFYLKLKNDGYKIVIDKSSDIKFYPFLEIAVFKYNKFPFNWDEIRFTKKWNCNTLAKNFSKNILIIKLMTLGDAVLVTPTIKALREKYSDYKITLLSMQPWSEIFENNQFIDELIALKDCSKYKIMNHRIYDIITSEFLTFKNWEYVFQLNCLDHYPEYRRTSLHLRDFYASMAGVYPLKDKKYYIFIDSYEKYKIKQLLKDLKIYEKKYVVIHTNAGWQLKNWDAEKWTQLVELLYKKFGYKTILVGGKNEGKDIHSEYLYNLAGKLKLKEVAALIEFSNLFIGLDSGVSHLASCMDIPVIMLFGNTHPKVAEPNCSKYICIHSSASCEIPCSLKFCAKGINCTSMISVNSVLKAVNMLLSEERNVVQEIWIEDSPADVFFKDWEWHIKLK